MNLTKCFAVGLCLSAMTSSAAFLVATNDFEGGTLEGTWTGGANALDDIVAGSTGLIDTNTPIVGVTDSKVLKLDTEGGIWTNDVNKSFALAPVFADMLVKFVPSEELPTLTDGKLALAIKLGLDGTNYLNVANNNGSTFAWAATAQAISTSDWYRVTVKLYWDELAEATYAQVLVNGNPVGSPLIMDGNTTLNSIGFQGTGFVDEVTVRDDDPFTPAVTYFGGTGPEVDPDELAAWKLANGITGLEDVDSFNAFVMNVAPETNGNSPVLVVDSIVVDGTTTLTVMAKYADDSLVALGTPLNNGAVLTVWGKADLGDVSWTNIGTDLTSFDQTTYHFFVVTTGETPTM